MNLRAEVTAPEWIFQDTESFLLLMELTLNLLFHSPSPLLNTFASPVSTYLLTLSPHPLLLRRSPPLPIPTSLETHSNIATCLLRTFLPRFLPPLPPPVQLTSWLKFLILYYFQYLSPLPLLPRLDYPLTPHYRTIPSSLEGLSLIYFLLSRPILLTTFLHSFFLPMYSTILECYILLVP